MLFFAALVLSCRRELSQIAPPPIDIASPVFSEAVKLCGVTIRQEHSGQEINVIGNNAVGSIVTILSDVYSMVMYLSRGAKNTINAHLIRGKEVTVKVELVEIDGSHDGMEKCKPATVMVK